MGDQGKNIKLLYDEYIFIDRMNNGSEYIFYGLSYGGYVTKEDNPLFGGYDLLYFIVANNGSVGMLNSNSLVLVMERVNGDIYRDPNWNSGKPLYFDNSEGLDFYEIVPVHWGLQIDGITFYGPDERPNDR